ncbi:hypothetical protein V6N11_061007 [Hibiscus sabdariffa]|uniref:Uncharacterized protein n=1 Tax=Hibiscus sabdariffa TaxID=183260 RepID=A0ABR2QS37_9ROSI
MDSSMCSSAPDPEMWIIQGTLAWRTSPVRTEDGPAAPRKRIEEASDSFMHAPLGSGDIAQLVELRSCNWVGEITGWVSNCPGGNDSILYLNRWLTFSKYDVNDPTAVDCASEAHKDMLEWFTKYVNTYHLGSCL